MLVSDPLDELMQALEDLSAHQKYNRLAFYNPYPSNGEMRTQRLFHALGATKTERLLRAGNREGKTFCGAAEMAMHLTGRYPDWWEGRRFNHPIKAWICGESSITVRDVQQKLLCGKPGVPSEFGTGFIPLECFRDKPSLSRGVTDAYDTIQAMHETNGVQDGISTGTFKSYEQGRTKFQGDEVDVGWCDEEPKDYDIYSEIRTRTISAGKVGERGIMYTTFTPLFGKTLLLVRFMDEKSDDRAEVVMTIYDAEHIKPEERAGIIAGWQVHEREARAMGVPMMGEGRVFPFGDDLISEEPIQFVPPHWRRLWGIDFGSGGAAHPFAAVLILHDLDTDTIHVHKAVKTDDPLVVHHVALMKPIAEQVRVAWPHDGNSRERGAQTETTTTAMLYRKAGLRMLPTHATFPDGGISTEAGITEMYERMQHGKLKVASTLMQGDWGNEFRSYHREKNLLVKVNDDLMSSTRVAIMAKNKADGAPLGSSLFRGQPQGQRQEIATGVDFDLFA